MLVYVSLEYRERIIFVIENSLSSVDLEMGYIHQKKSLPGNPQQNLNATYQRSDI